MKQDQKAMSDTGWTNGLYVERAIEACFPKGRKYPESPMDLWINSEETEDNTEPFTDADTFAAFAVTFNRNKFG